VNIRLSSLRDTRQVVSRRVESWRAAGLAGSEGGADERLAALSKDVLVGLLVPFSKDPTWLIAVAADSICA
jgi:hypothetical protein